MQCRKERNKSDLKKLKAKEKPSWKKTLLKPVSYTSKQTSLTRLGDQISLANLLRKGKERKEKERKGENKRKRKELDKNEMKIKDKKTQLRSEEIEKKRKENEIILKERK